MSDAPFDIGALREGLNAKPTVLQLDASRAGVSLIPISVGPGMAEMFYGFVNALRLGATSDALWFAMRFAPGQLRHAAAMLIEAERRSVGFTVTSSVQVFVNQLAELERACEAAVEAMRLVQLPPTREECEGAQRLLEMLSSGRNAEARSAAACVDRSRLNAAVAELFALRAMQADSEQVTIPLAEAQEWILEKLYGKAG